MTCRIGHVHRDAHLDFAQVVRAEGLVPAGVGDGAGHVRRPGKRQGPLGVTVPAHESQRVGERAPAAGWSSAATVSKREVPCAGRSTMPARHPRPSKAALDSTA